MRLTKITCTLGPASDTEKSLKLLMDEGLNVARFNFSHGSHEEHGERLGRVRKAAKAAKKTIGIMLDTKGPEIRTGDVTTPIPVRAGQKVMFVVKKFESDDMPVINVNYPEFVKDAKKTKELIVDNGEILFDILSITKDGVLTRARNGGSIGSRRHINLPGVDISLPSITEKDWKDFDFAIKEKMDFIALSFVRRGADIKQVRDYMEKKGAKISLFAKIETKLAVENIEDIIDASDGIMIARGDLGAEIPFEKVPAVQDMIVEYCRATRKPVIVATQMLESMIQNPMPTRAEVTDVAYAAESGADCTMLSGETAKGKFPLLAVEAMAKVLKEVNDRGPCVPLWSEVENPEAGALTQAVLSISEQYKVSAIVVPNAQEVTVLEAAACRAGTPILAFTKDAALQRRLQIVYGTFTFDGTNPSDAVLKTALKSIGVPSKKSHKLLVLTRNGKSGDELTLDLRTI